MKTNLSPAVKRIIDRKIIIILLLNLAVPKYEPIIAPMKTASIQKIILKSI